MIPFPGESIGIDRAFGVAYNTIRRRGSIGSSPPTATLASGQEWRAWVFDDSQTYLEAGADVAVSWVVEVVSGSATVTASMGLDPAYGDSTAAHPTALGTHTVTAGSLVLPTTLTAADILTGTPSMLVLECSAGSVEVQQVKLRVWPTGGVAGGWSDIQPGFSTTPVLPSIQGAFVSRSTVSGPTTDYEGAWDGAMAALAGGSSTGGAGPHATSGGVVGTSFDVGVAWLRAGPTVAPYIDVATSVDTETATVSGTPHGFIAVIEGQSIAGRFPIASGLAEGVDYIRPPAEVAGDVDHLVQSEGAAASQWVNATATVGMFGGGPSPLAAGPSVASESTDTNPIAEGLILRSQVEGLPAVTYDSTDTSGTVALAATGRYVIVYGSHSMAATAPPFPGLAPFTGSERFTFIYDVAFGSGIPGPEFAPMLTFVDMPPYRVWSPSAAPVVTIPLRQLHRDDGLGVTPPRAFGGASRIRTGRAYGYD